MCPAYPPPSSLTVPAPARRPACLAVAHFELAGNRAQGGEPRLDPGRLQAAHGYRERRGAPPFQSRSKSRDVDPSGMALRDRGQFSAVVRYLAELPTA